MKKVKVTADEILAYMQEYFVDNGVFPTQQNIGEEFDINRKWVSVLQGKLLETGKIKYAGDDTITPYSKPQYDYRGVCIDLGPKIKKKL